MSDKKKNEFFFNEITRRDMLKALGTTSAASLMGLSLSDIGYGAPRSVDRPNIVFILSDNCRADYNGFMGHPFIQTPAIDRLAQEGVAFENAFCTTAFCSPSRASFLTGTYARTHGVLNNSTPWTGKQKVFMEYLKDAGYDTAFIGKFHMPGEGLPDLPFLDTFVSFTIKENQGQYFNCPLVENGVPTESNKEYLIEELTDRAITFMDGEHENPFCLYLSYKTAHFPFLPPKDLDGIYKNEPVELPPEADSWLGRTNGNVFEGTMMGSLEDLSRRYCEAITGMDREIDRVLKKIDEPHLRDNTIVIYASDNGYMWGEHRIVGINWPYEESIKLPFVVRCPWLVGDPGTRCNQMILNIDLAPTLLDIAGLPIPADMEGESFLPILGNRSTEGRKAWFYEYYKYFPENVPTMFGVRTENHKYFEFERGLKPRLYDLVSDPKEMRNLFGTPEGDLVMPELLVMFEALKAGERI
jgi:N-acetylglucosamine-6-sulfatase